MARKFSNFPRISEEEVQSNPGGVANLLNDFIDTTINELQAAVAPNNVIQQKTVNTTVSIRVATDVNNRVNQPIIYRQEVSATEFNTVDEVRITSWRYTAGNITSGQEGLYLSWRRSRNGILVTIFSSADSNVQQDRVFNITFILEGEGR